MPKNKKLALKLVKLPYQILTNDDEVCIPSLSSNLVVVHKVAISWTHYYQFWFDRMKIREISCEKANEQKLECS